MKDHIWAGRKVLVTGADGFIGSHLTDELIRRGARVTAIVRRTSASQVTNQFRNLSPHTVASLERIIHVDLSSASAGLILSTVDAEVWFHLAADAYVPASFSQAATVVQSNVTSTLHILEAALQRRPAHVLITSSSEVYGTQAEAITEAHPLHPATPYAASKVACDRLAWSYFNSFGAPITIVRPFNCYGPRHVYDAVPLFLAKAVRGEPITINGSGEQTRDLTYVTDTVAAFLALACLAPAGESFNIGTGVDHRIIDVAKAIVEISGSSSEIIHAAARSGEVYKLQASAAKLQHTTGWCPQYNLADGLAANLAWLRENMPAAR